MVSRSPEKAEKWRAKGAESAIVDVGDEDALRKVFQQGTCAFLLNPPAAPSTDTDKEELRTKSSIVRALDGSGLKKIVASSTYGAQPGEHRGELGTLYAYEQALAAQSIPAPVLRAAYYMSNWDQALDTAREGTLQTFFPSNVRIPMVAPEDVGDAAARLLMAEAGTPQLRYIEGPLPYRSSDVADALAAALHRPVALSVVPREQWRSAWR